MKISRTRSCMTGLLVGLIAGLCLVTQVKNAQAATELFITVYGGTWEDAWRKAVIEPFEKANPDIKVKIAQGLTFQNVALMRAQKDDVKVDVIIADLVAASVAAEEGLCYPLSTKTVPNLADTYPELRVPGDYAAVIQFSPSVIAYNVEKVRPAPDSWSVLWDPKYKGKIAVQHIDTAPGIMFFMLTNVINGGTVYDADLGFEAMKKLKGSVVTFPTTHAEVAQLFTRGDIVMAHWVLDRAAMFKNVDPRFSWVFPKEGTLMSPSALAIAKGTKHLDEALKYINFALSPEAQAAMAKYVFSARVNSKSVVDPETAKAIPSTIDMLKISRSPDWKKVNELRPQWVDRWNREIVR